MTLSVPWSDGGWRRTLVYGLGLSGRASTRLLRSRGVEVVGVDRRSAAELDLEGLAGPGFELLAGAELETLPPGIDGVVVSPGVGGDRPLLRDARERGVPVVAEVELAFAFLEGEVVAITGSNGKSTTTALTGALLAAGGRQVEVCGNIGRPLADCVEGPAGRIFVVELSSFQLETIDRFHPRAAALLNLSPDHLDRHGSLEGYLAAKTRIFSRQEPSDVAVLNADDPGLRGVTTRARRRVFSLLGEVEDGCRLDGERVLEIAGGLSRGELFTLADVPLAGRHNLENAMAAALLARALGAQPSAIVTGLRGFVGLPHRMARVAEHGGVAWYDDSKGTNIGATARSLEGFADGQVHVILGGRNKGADFAELRPLVLRKARRVYLIGEAATELGRALGAGIDVEHAGTLERAVASAAEHAQTGEVVLLSPACASFDQFRDYRDRGERFQRLVRALSEQEAGEEVGAQAGV